MPELYSKSAPSPQPLIAALTLARAGFAVFFSGANKRPACPHGYQDATSDPDAVMDLWRLHPGPLVAVATGAPSGASVLDLDRQHGAAGWWREHRHRLPETRTHRTRSEGLHLWFRHHPGLRCSVSRIGDGVDIRADGGYAIWWPAAGLPVHSDAPMAEWPAWLAPPPPAPAWTPPVAAAWQGDDRRARRYAEAALRRGIEAVAGAGEGNRNQTLFREAAGLLRLVAGGGTTPGEVAETMARAALAAGLPSREVQSTLASALRAGGR
ncbi:MAG: bifunctional DNA primase/polymerase [Rhodospirillales bacterium]|nr:bifunctional DNA primase/polymerase [Rhodospirillales bacterium]